VLTYYKILELDVVSRIKSPRILTKVHSRRIIDPKGHRH
jgi:hypothetical protein